MPRLLQACGMLLACLRNGCIKGRRLTPSHTDGHDYYVVYEVWL